MKFNKTDFLNSELGKACIEAVTVLDAALKERSRLNAQVHCETAHKLDRERDCQLARWEAYKLAIKQFYGIEYHFTRTDEYFGICTEDEENWLYKLGYAEQLEKKLNSLYAQQSRLNTENQLERLEYRELQEEINMLEREWQRL